MWCIIAEETQVSKVCKALTRSILSIGQRIAKFNHADLQCVSGIKNSYYLYPRSHHKSLNTQVHSSFLSRGIVEYNCFENAWE